jgi:hypothetical protein
MLIQQQVETMVLLDRLVTIRNPFLILNCILFWVSTCGMESYMCIDIFFSTVTPEGGKEERRACLSKDASGRGEVTIH